MFKLEREVTALCDWLMGNQWFYTSDKQSFTCSCYYVSQYV